MQLKNIWKNICRMQRIANAVSRIYISAASKLALRFMLLV